MSTLKIYTRIFIFALSVALAYHYSYGEPSSNFERKEIAVELEFTNKVELEARYLQVLERVSGEYRQFFSRNVQQLNSMFSQFIQELQGNKGLIYLSDRSLLQPIADIPSFFAAIRSYQLGILEFETRVKTLFVLPTSKEIEFMSSIDVAPLVELYREQIKKIESNIANLSYKLVLPNGSLYLQQGLNTEDLRQMNLYTAEQINQIRRKAAQLKAMKMADRLLIDQTYNRFVFQKIQAFIKTFGITQRYRSQQNIAALEAAKNDLQEAFWTRSYLRATFGVKLGSFGVEFKKRWFNVDYFFNATRIQFIPRVIMNENDLMQVQDQLFYALRMIEGRSEEVLAASVPFFSRVMSALDLISGNKPEANANHVVLKLMAADLYEEMMIGKGGGFRKMRAHYRDRYYSNEKDSEYFKQMKEDYAPENFTTTTDFATMDSDSLRGVFQAALFSLQNYEVQLYEANGLMETIKRLTPQNQRHEI